jgi:hypothetical protein
VKTPEKESFEAYSIVESIVYEIVRTVV